jgi:hypothetical protein
MTVLKYCNKIKYKKNSIKWIFRYKLVIGRIFNYENLYIDIKNLYTRVSFNTGLLFITRRSETSQ